MWHFFRYTHSKLFLIFVVILLYVGWLAIIRATSWDITSNSYFNPTIDVTRQLPSPAAYNTILAIFLFLFAIHVRENVDKHNVTLRDFSDLMHRIKRFFIELPADRFFTENMIKDSSAAKKLFGLKGYCENLPNVFMEILTCDDLMFDNDYYQSPSSNSPWRKKSDDSDFNTNTIPTNLGTFHTNQQKYSGIPAECGKPTFRALLSLRTGVSVFESIDSSTSKEDLHLKERITPGKLTRLKLLYEFIHDELNTIIGINLKHGLHYVYNLILLLICCLQCVCIPLSWAYCGWIIGSIISVLHFILLLYLLDGVSTITPIFYKFSEGYQTIQDHMTQTIQELRWISASEWSNEHVPLIEKQKTPSLGGFTPLSQYQQHGGNLISSPSSQTFSNKRTK